MFHLHILNGSYHVLCVKLETMFTCGFGQQQPLLFRPQTAQYQHLVCEGNNELQAGGHDREIKA